MREKLIKFMQGRYGVDRLGKCIMYIGLFFLILNMLMPNPFFSGIAFLLLIFSYYRIFSKDIAKRSRENSKYVYYADKLKYELKNRTFNIRNYFSKSSQGGCNSKIFKCPACRQKLRVPKGRGRIQITCKKCGCEFVERT